MSFSMNGIPTTYRNRRDSDSKTWYAKKDKPFYGGVPRARGPFYRKRRYPILGLALLILLFFYFRSASDPRSILTRENGEKGQEDNGLQSLSNTAKQGRIRGVFLESWGAYTRSAWGKDEFKPVSKTGKNMITGGMGWIIIDALDTMHLMDLQQPLAEARRWVLTEHTFDVDAEVSVFETTIRMLGGLLSIFHLTQDQAYLEKAKDLGDRLLGAYDTPSGIPLASVNLRTRKGARNHEEMGASSTAEVASLQLEMKFLSHALKDAKYASASEKVMARLRQNSPEGGLVPIFVNPESGNYQGSEIRLGSRGDSYYEYLAKQWLMMEDPIYKEEYEKSVAGIKKYLVGKSYPKGLTYVGEKHAGVASPTDPKMDHLVCFLPGTLALGATRGLPYREAQKQVWWSDLQDEDMQLAKELTLSCYEMYNSTTTGLAPEIVFFNDNPDNPSTTSRSPDIHIHDRDRHNLMRPETVESLFVMWRLTRDETHREWAWLIFVAFEKYLHVGKDQGYTSIEDVMSDRPQARDNMESFWLAETLKYLFLTFADERDEKALGLDEIVFNTEAHIFPILSQEDRVHRETLQPWQRMQGKVESKIANDAKVLAESPAEKDA
ncbi:protein of unknown function, partial [Taphrina deformans PYCC 5710]